MAHISVLLKEVVDGLSGRPGEVLLDCTVGYGGHSAAVCRSVANNIRVIGIDRDKDAVAGAEKLLQSLGCDANVANASFRDLDKVLENAGVGSVNMVLMDLGISSPQIESSGRGFSFLRNEPLIMTMSTDASGSVFTARDIVNDWEEGNIADVLYGYGEERYSRRIARAIVEARAEKPIETTGELVEIIKRAVPPHYAKGRIHPATRTFQAMRIAVNDELQALKEGLQKAFGALAPGGRMAVISFHSLEDRIVKNFMRDKADEGKAEVMTKKPITPSDEEIENNPRSRSAKLRIIKKI